METLGEDLALLSVGPSGKVQQARRLAIALAGSELVRLAARGKVDVADGRIVARDAARTGDAELDLAMESLVQAGRPPKARAWVGRPRRGIVAAYLGRLTGSGALRGEDAFFGTRWHAVGEAAWAADAASPAPGRPGTCGWAGRDLVPAAHAATHAATQAAESATIAAVAAAAPGSAAGSPT